jgi:hypothetical protein
MNFTYGAYKEMISLLKENHYEICNYQTYQSSNRCVILRHDVDFSLEAALRFAQLEYKNGVRSTYFILLSTSFYNLLYRKDSDIIKEIRVMGHDIGLHFDEANYSISCKEELIRHVQKEISILSQGLGIAIKAVSMHRPSKWVLEANVQFDTVINSYGKKFFNDFKYLSDSRMHWREDVYQVIESKAYERLHILTHPIWYGAEESTMQVQLKDFIRAQKYNCYDAVRDNIRDLDEVLLKADI